MLQKDMKNDMEEMDKQLPYRLQQKDDTKKHFSLSRKLKTLYKVISERESSILSGNKKYFEEETEKHILKMEKYKQFLRKTYNSRIETIAHNESVKTLADLVENVTLDTEPLKQDLTEYVSYIPFEDIYHRYEDLETSSDEVVVKIKSLTSPYLQYLESCFKDECMNTINRIKRQLIRTKDLPSHQVILQKIFQKIEDIKKEQTGLKIDLEDISKELEEDRTLNRQHRLDHHVETEEVVGKVFKFHQDSYELQKKIFDAKKEVFRCTKEKIAAKELIVKCGTSCNIYPKLSKTIFDIECFINDPITGSQFKDDYYGPLFNYLQSNDLIERDLWHELVPLMSVFIFGKVSTARAFHLALTKSEKNFEGYTLMGMDDFYTRPYQEIPHDLREKVNPASEIVKVNIRFHHILFRLLDGNVRVNTRSLNIELFRSKVAVVSEDSLSIGYWNSLISVGWFTNASVSTEDSPLDHLQTLYRFIEGYLKEDIKLRRIQVELESSKTELEELHRYEHRIDYVILHRAKDKYHLLLERELKLKEDLIRSNVELKCFDSFKAKLKFVDSWNLAEITAWILKVDLTKVKTKMGMKSEIEQEFAKLHDINLVISIHNNEMERWMLKTLDHWNQWNVATISNHKNYLVLCQELNNDYFKTILASMSEGMDILNYKCDNSQVAQEYCSKIKLIEIKGMLHKLYNDLKFLKSEMAACQQVVRDSDANDVDISRAYKECDLEYVIEGIDELQNELKECPDPLSREQYVDLRETIQDIVNFSTAPT